MKRTKTIRTQFIFSFTLIAVVIIGTISVITLNLVNRHFDRYVVERQNEVLVKLTKSLTTSYSSETEEWDLTEIQQVAKLAESEAIDVTVYNQENRLIWQNSQQKSSHMSGGMMSEHHQMMNQEMRDKSDNYIEKNVKMKVQKKSIGKVTFGYYGPLTYTNHDLIFIADLRKSLLIIAIVALILALLFAVLAARRLSLPIIQVSRFTKGIAKGCYQKELPPLSTTTEINELIYAVHDLSSQLEQQQELRNRLTSDISHEIRTPLTTLKGHIEAMLDGIWAPTPERLESCYEEVNRLSRLIGDIDKLTELENQQEKLQKSSFDLNQIAKRISLNIQPLMKQKKIDFSFNGEETSIVADQDKVSQVMTNLLTNALKFTDSGGQITLTVDNSDSEARILVKDTGIGISPLDLKHIFLRFYMVDSARNQQSQGIGLAIVKSIVKAHGGRIEVNSQPEKGTEFAIYLPLI